MLKKENRLSKITRRASGKKYFSPLFTVQILENDQNSPRVGFIITKRIDKRATVRNRTKRVLQKAIENFLENLTGKDIIIVAKKPLLFGDLEEVSTELKGIFEKIK